MIYSLSVIIPCRNEELYILNTLKHIYNSDLTEIDLEVLLIDGMSDDNTILLLKENISQFPGLQIITNENQKTPFAFNIGIKHSTKKYIVTLGARHLVDRMYFINCLKEFARDSKIMCVGGKSVAINNNEYSFAISKAMSSGFGVGYSNFRSIIQSQEVDTVGTPIYDKRLFELIGNFDENLTRNQDDDFNFRLINSGYKIWMCIDALVYYIVRPSYTQLFSQFRQYGYWKVYVNKKHKSVTTTRQLVPFFFFVFLISYPLQFLIPIYNLLYISVLLIYILANLMYSIKLVEKGRNMFMISSAFICLHIGYGLGYTQGLIDFLILNKKPSVTMEKLTR